MKMFDLRLCVFVFVNLFLIARSSIPVEILCANPTCTEPISKAIGSVAYVPSSRNALGFKPGQDITIISKSKNKNEYWGAVINGRTGYVPPHLIKEIRAFYKLEDLIPVKIDSSAQKTSTNAKDNTSELPEQNKTSSENSPQASQQFGTSPTPQTVSSVPEKIVSSPDLSTPVGYATEKLAPESAHGGLDLQKNIATTKTYTIIEGTTVFVEGNDQITPSATIDAKATAQTPIPMVATEEKATKPPVAEQQRATISPHVINLNSNYEGQLSLSKNATVENEDEEDEEEEEDDAMEEDEPNENDNEEEEEDDDGLVNIINEIKLEKTRDIVIDPQVKESSTENVQGDSGKLDPMVQPSTQLYDAVIQEIKKETDPVERETATTVNVVESSVTHTINTHVDKGGENETKPAEEHLHHAEFEKNVVAQSDKMENSNPTGFNIMNNENDLKVNNFYPDVPSQGSPVINEPTLNQQSPTPETVSMLNEHSVYADSLPGSPETRSLKVEDEMKVTTEKINEIDSNIQPTTQQYNENTLAEGTTEKVEQNEATPPENLNKVDYLVPTAEAVTEVPVQVNEEPMVTTPTVEIATEVPKTSEKAKVSTPAADVTQSFENIAEQNKESSPNADSFNQRIEEVVEQPETGVEGPGFLSQVTGMFSGWFGSAEESTGEKLSPDLSAVENANRITPSESVNDLAADSCQNPDMDCNSFQTEEQESFWNSWLPSNIGFGGSPSSSNTFLYLVITAVTVLLFTLGHNLIEKKGNTGPLIAKINKLEQELMITSKECCLLKDEIQSAKDKITLYENSANDELVVSLQAELEEAKKTRLELESSNEMLQQELDAATEAGLDLNKMLSEVLTQKGGSESLLESVESLQAQLNSQQKVIDEMTKKLGVKNQENEALQTALETANEKTENLEGELYDLKQNLNLHLKEKEDLTQDLKSQISQLQTRINQLGDNKEKEVSKFKKNLEELRKKYSESSKALAVKEEEFKALKESVKSLKTKGNVNLETVFDVSRFKAELAVSEKDNDALKASLKEGENDKKKLEEQIKSLDAEIQNLKKRYDEAELKKVEAEKKLDVLSTYFKEKETQLQKELGLQEAMWAQKKGDEKAVYNMMKSLQEEVESYKSQNETLKKEILDQERGLKNQIATLEQKAHENWVAARQAERKLEENKQETAQLRNRLTLIEKNNSNAEGKANHRGPEELNGEATSPVLHDTSSPLLFPPLPLDPNGGSLLPPGFMPHPMFMPPPVAGFIPPPPFLPGDRRPPPLGRMSSPPLNSRFSPSSPADYPFERMSSPPLSPPARNYRSPTEADREHFRHRTPPYPPLHHRNWDESNEMPGFIPISSQRDSVREPKGSNISSGHSSSDSLEKSSRHSGRV